MKCFNPGELDGITDLWQETLGDPRVCVAILDGSVDAEHPSFRHARLEFGQTGTVRLSRNDPGSGHGTHVTSLVFGAHDGPVKGLAPSCSGWIEPIFDPNGEQLLLSCSQTRLAAAIRAATERAFPRYQALVINISAGGLTPHGLATMALASAIESCRGKNVLLIAAAGNNGCFECLHVPGSLPSVLAVGAMDASGNPLDFSNWGGVYATQGILAPGENILGATAGGGYVCQSGTSFATPIVAGVAVLLLSLQLKRGDRADPLAVREALLASAVGCDLQPVRECDRLLAGRLNVKGAIAMLSNRRGVPSVADQNDARTDRVAPGASTQGGGESGGVPSKPESTGAPLEARAFDAGTQGQFADRVRDPRVAPAGAGGGVERTTAMIAPSACTCGSSQANRPKVYVIGSRLGFDLGTPVLEQSLQDNFFSGDLRPDEMAIRSPVNLLRYLLGWSGQRSGQGAPAGNLSVNGHLYDAASVLWVLYQDACPKYVIRPGGPFADSAYKELLYFFIESSGLNLSSFGIRYDCLEDYLECHGGLATPLEGSPSNTATGGQPQKGGSTGPARAGGQAEGKLAHADPTPDHAAKPPGGAGAQAGSSDGIAALFGETLSKAAHRHRRRGLRNSDPLHGRPGGGDRTQPEGDRDLEYNDAVRPVPGPDQG